jgi:hypothetical protein
MKERELRLLIGSSSIPDQSIYSSLDKSSLVPHRLINHTI